MDKVAVANNLINRKETADKKGKKKRLEKNLQKKEKKRKNERKTTHSKKKLEKKMRTNAVAIREMRKSRKRDVSAGGKYLKIEHTFQFLKMWDKKIMKWC